MSLLNPDTNPQTNPEANSQARRRDYVEVDGVRVRVEMLGKGPPVLFLHGWGGRIESWGLIPESIGLESVTANRTKILLDLPCFGESGFPPVPWGNADFRDFLAAFLRRLGLDRVTIVGHSRGGAIGIAVAAKWPRLVEKLVLVDSAGIVPPRRLKYHLRVRFAKTARGVLSLPWLHRWRDRGMQRVLSMIGSSDYNQAANPIVRATLVKVVNDDLRQLFPLIQAPTLIIWGSADQDTPLADARLMEQGIPDAGLVVLEGAGHFAYLDQADRFCRILNHFLEH